MMTHNTAAASAIMMAVGAATIPAKAQLTYTQDQGITDIFYYVNDFAVSELVRVNLADFPSGYAGSLQAGPAQASYLQSLDVAFTGSLVADTDRFALAGSSSTSASLATPQSGYFVGVSNAIAYSISVAEDTTLRFQFAFEGDDPAEVVLQESLRLIMSSANGAFAPFIAGFNDQDVTIPSGFDFTIDVAAGETISFDLLHSVVANADRPNSVTAWDLDSSFDFSIEVVPAPGSIAVLGLAGLVASRRRRA